MDVAVIILCVEMRAIIRFDNNNIFYLKNILTRSEISLKNCFFIKKILKSQLFNFLKIISIPYVFIN